MALLKFFVDSSDVLSFVIFLKAGFLKVSEEVIIELLDCSSKSEPELRAKEIIAQLQGKGLSLEKILVLKENCSFGTPHQILVKLYELIYLDPEKETAENPELYQKSLITLLDLVFEMERNGLNTLPHVVKELERLKSQKIQGAEEGKNNSISLMTIHKSKGLEYPLIALVETADSWFRFDRYWLKANNGVYYCGTSQQMPKEDPAFSQVFTETQKTMHQETIRLLYVALTRSSQYLYVSAHKVKSSTGFGFYASLLRCFKRSSNLEEEGFRYFLKASQDLDLEAKSKVQVTSSAPVKYIKSISSHIETKVVHPHNSVAHEELVYSPSQGLRVSEALKALIGTFIHKTFELHCKGQDLNLELLWQQDLASDLVFIRERLSEKRRKTLRILFLLKLKST